MDYGAYKGHKNGAISLHYHKNILLFFKDSHGKIDKNKYLSLLLTKYELNNDLLNIDQIWIRILSTKKCITNGFNFYIFKDSNWDFLKFVRLKISPKSDQ